MDFIKENWDLIKETVRKEYDLSDISYNTWIKPLNFYNEKNDVVTIMIPSDQAHALKYISSKYKSYFQVTISEMMNHTYDIAFILEKDAEDETLSTPGNIYNINHENANLNSKYRFDTFVVGSNNKFAHSASLAAAESPGVAYNPLYLYGGAGLGKTHLMHSIGHFILDQNPDMKVLYVTSEQFTNEVIDSIRSGNATKMNQLREKYRTVDVLLIDDIQFIIGKESTQEEFFHTFNVLHSSGNNSRQIKEDVFQYIANNIKSNIRELEGAYNKVIAFSKLNNVEITLDNVEEALKDIISPNQKRNITHALIISVVAEHFSITPEEIISKRRNSEYVLPRQICMYLCRILTPDSLQSIGKSLGKKDHTTVIHGIDKITAEVKENKEMENTISIIKKKLNCE